MKVLLIGANGQVGHELAKRLKLSRHQLIKKEVRPEQGSETQILDLTNLDSVAVTIIKLQPDVVINSAAYTAVDKAETEQDLAMTINAETVNVIAEAVKAIDSILVHYSTDYVFDGSGDQPCKEDADTSPVNFYGQSKLDGKVYIRQSECKHLIFRTSWVYGAHGHNFVKTMLKVGSDCKDLSVVSDQVGSPTSAEQIAEGTLKALDKIEEDQSKIADYVGTYHIAGAGYTNWPDFEKEIFSVGQSLDPKVEGFTVQGIPSSAYPTPARIPFNSRLYCSHLESKFGFELDFWQNQLK